MAQASIDVSVKYAGDQACIEGDADMIKQIFLNIILNAQQAMPDGGMLKIETKKSSAGLLPEESPMVEIIFQDSGPGISQENLSRIFDPFFSTKQGGAGLGLAIVHNIVSQHNGSVNMENSLQRGAIVNVSFPLLSDSE
jgi:signal transduction histidine kinase